MEPNIIIIQKLLSKPRTIAELYEALKEEKFLCPDDLARMLSKLRKQGLIKGKFSEEKTAWVYWVDEKHE